MAPAQFALLMLKVFAVALLTIPVGGILSVSVMLLALLASGLAITVSLLR
jgi:hypothetical protein